MARVHMFVGLLGLIVFLLSGQYLRWNVPKIDPDDELTRMMFRANHLYILFCSVIHLFMGCSLATWTGRPAWSLIPSAITMLAMVGVVAAFFIDPATRDMQRDVTRFSIIAMTAASCAHLVGRFWTRSSGGQAV